MPDREFIHSSADVASTLLFALDAGFEVRLDAPQPEPRPYMLARDEAATMEKGSFYVFRPEWVYGPFQTMMISDGYNAGKYFVQPRVNYAPIAIYFQGERLDKGRRRFGSAVVSSYRDSLVMPAKELRPSPPDMQSWFKRFVSHLSSGFVVKAGVHKYHISRNVAHDPAADECLPPFDFIPWGTEVLRDLMQNKAK